MNRPKLLIPVYRVGALLLLLATTWGSAAFAQAVQAIRNTGSEVEAAATERQMDSIATAVAVHLGRFTAFRTMTMSSAATPAELGFLSVQDRFRSRAEALLEARGDPEEFRRAVREYNEAAREMETFAPVGLSMLNSVAPQDLSGLDAAQAFALTMPIPQIHTIVPDVVFTTGPAYGLGDGDGVLEFGLSTNLLGAAAGTAFDLLGSDGLAQYFKDNISAGTAIPLDGTERLTAQVGIGLGGINLGRATIWPILNMGQADSADVRVPRELLVRQPGESAWSSPAISVAVIPYTMKRLEELVGRGRFVPIPTIGLQLPYYFPGDPFTAVAALFSDRRKDFLREGNVRVAIGVSIPLLKVKARQTDEEER